MQERSAIQVEEPQANKDASGKFTTNVDEYKINADEANRLQAEIDSKKQAKNFVERDFIKCV